jgi:hypothetical protein
LNWLASCLAAFAISLVALKKIALDFRIADLIYYHEYFINYRQVRSHWAFPFWEFSIQLLSIKFGTVM